MNMNNPMNDAIKTEIERLKKEDPMSALQFGAKKDILQRLLSAFKTERGVHLDHVLAVLGSMAGYACLLAALEDAKKSPQAQQGLMIVQDKQGETYYFGDLINAYLFTNEYSVYALLAGMANSLGSPSTVDIEELTQHVTASGGSPEFGVPRMPEGHSIPETPEQMLHNLWPVLMPIIDGYCNSASDRPILLGLAIQELMQIGKDALKANLAVHIAMECAVPMSKRLMKQGK